MKYVPFDLNGWDYSQPRSAFVESHGGKAFGLMLCEHLTLGSRFFRVPPWFMMNQDNASIADETNTWIRDEWLAAHRSTLVIIRSSGHDEDWHDGRSGVDRSNCGSGHPLVIKTYLRVRINEGNLPLVVQSFEDGYGCVIDVGWSWILGKPVVRFAIGNTTTVGKNTGYTSATWDNEARFGLYDAETNEPIIPLEDPKLSPIIPELVRELVASLRRIGIDYGVQLEAVVHPHHPEKWHLVQLRPTPAAMHGITSPLPRDGRLMMASCRVSKPGLCEGETIILSDRDNDISVQDLAYEIARIEGTQYDRSVDDEPERALLSGKIVLWDDRSFPKPEWSVYRALGIARLGAIGQVMVFPLVNSSHGTSLDMTSFDPLYASKETAAKTASILFGTPGNSGYLRSYWPRGEWPTSPVRLCIASDGIYGEIRLP